MVTLRAIGQHIFLAAGRERLDVGEDVIPPAGIQARGMVAQFVENLFHLERRGQRLDQHGRPDGPLRDPQQRLGLDEDVIPQPGFQVRLQLRQVEVRPRPAVDQRLRVVEEEQPEIDDGAGQRPSVDRQVLLAQPPAARADHDGGRFLADLVFLAVLGGVIQVAANGVEQVQLAVDDVEPARRGGILEIGHPHLGAGIECVDAHLPAGRSGDLAPAIDQSGSRRRNLPAGVRADAGGLGEEIDLLPGGDPLAPLAPGRQQFGAPSGGGPVELGHEDQCLRRQDLVEPRVHGAFDLRGLGWSEHRLSPVKTRILVFLGLGGLVGSAGSNGRPPPKGGRPISGTALPRWTRLGPACHCPGSGR